MTKDELLMDKLGRQKEMARQALEQPEQFFYGQDPNVLPAHGKGEINDK